MEISRISLDLHCYKIDKSKELRYLNVKLNTDTDVTVPLFYGADLMTDSTVVYSSNYCRIHAKYAKRGLAVKLLFPADVALAGINNCQSGAWFYSIQGVFQVFFEYHGRHAQLNVVTSLVELWKSRQGNPHLPDKLAVTMEEVLRGTRSSGSWPPVDQLTPLSQLLARCELEMPVEVLLVESDPLPVVDSTSSLPVEEPIPTTDSFCFFSSDMLRRTQSFSRRCHVEERYLAEALVAFLKLVKSESKERNDDLFCSFLETVCNYSSLITDPSKLRCFRSDWGVDEKQNALLCLVCEWLGKNLNVFKDTVAKRVDDFKTGHMGAGGELPPAESLVSEIFPECMRLLVSYWIGLYGMAEPTAPSPPVVVAEEPQVRKNRVDHSYYSNKDAAGAPGAVAKEDAAPNKRADHSYSTSSPFAEAIFSDGVGISPMPRKDHTYVASGSSPSEDPAAAPAMREDHTYVSTKERRSKVGVGGGGTATVALTTQPDPGIKDDHDYDVPNAKRFKSAVMIGAQDTVVLDAGKHPFVQLVLEFLNNVLLSGVAHVVYTRLVHL